MTSPFQAATPDSAIEQVRLGVIAYFNAWGVTAPVVFGTRELTKQVNQGPGGANRIVIAPVSDEVLAPRKNVAGNPPVIATLEREFVVSAWAVGADPNDPVGNDIALLQLREKFTAALRGIGHVAVQITKWDHVVTPVERIYGAEARASLKVREHWYGPSLTVRTPKPALERELESGTQEA